MPAAASVRRRAGSAFTFRTAELDRVKLHPMIDEAIAQAFGDLALQRFQFRVHEFDDLTGFDVYQVIVVRFRRCFVAGTPVAEIVTVQNAGFFEEAHGAIYCCDGDLGIDPGCPAIQRFHIGVVVTFRQDARDHAPLFGDPQAALGTELFEIDGLMQNLLRKIKIAPPR